MTIVYYSLDHSKYNAQLFIYHFTHSILILPTVLYYISIFLQQLSSFVPQRYEINI